MVSARCNQALGRADLHRTAGGGGASGSSFRGQNTSVDSEQLLQLALSDCVVASELQQQDDGRTLSALALDLQALQADVTTALDELAAARASSDHGGDDGDDFTGQQHDWEELSSAHLVVATTTGRESGTVPTSAPLQPSARVRVCEIYENERRPFTKFSWAKDPSAIASGGFHHSTLLPTDRKRWSTADGEPLSSSSSILAGASVTVSVRPDGVEVIDDSISAPDDLVWMEKEWRVIVEPGRTDSEGWEYAFNWSRPFSAQKVLDGVAADFVRRRRWQRRAARSLID